MPPLSVHGQLAFHFALKRCGQRKCTHFFLRHDAINLITIPVSLRSPAIPHDSKIALTNRFILQPAGYLQPPLNGVGGVDLLTQ